MLQEKAELSEKYHLQLEREDYYAKVKQMLREMQQENEYLVQQNCFLEQRATHLDEAYQDLRLQIDKIKNPVEIYNDGVSVSETQSYTPTESQQVTKFGSSQYGSGLRMSSPALR